MKQKKKLANIITAAVIAAIAICAVLAIGWNAGWFAGKEISPVTVSGTLGTARLDRSGLQSPLSAGDTLQSSDSISADTDSAIDLALTQGTIRLDADSSVSLTQADADAPELELQAGRVMLSVSGEQAAANMQGLTCGSDNAVWTMDISSDTVCVFAGEVTCGDVTVSAGNSLCGDTSASIDISSLDDPLVNWLLTLTSRDDLCFTQDELNALREAREAQAQAELEEALDLADASQSAAESTEVSSAQEDAASSAAESTANEDSSADAAENNSSDKDTAASQSKDSAAAKDSNTSDSGSTGTKTGGSAAANSGKNSESASGTGKTETSKTETASSAAAEPEEPEPEETVKTYTCTIRIRCDSILNNMDALDSSKTSYVPSSGTILGTTTVSFTEGETVFDVLKRTCSSAGIALEYTYSSAYSSNYVEGIAHIYEFDCGPSSGWMYKVNGSFPSKGCSAYTLSDGDSITWCYTCNGTGSDT